MAPMHKRRRNPLCQSGSPSSADENSLSKKTTRSNSAQKPRKRPKLDDTQKANIKARPTSGPLVESPLNIIDNLQNVNELLVSLRSVTPTVKSCKKTTKSALRKRVSKSMFDEPEESLTPKNTSSHFVEDVFFGEREDVDPFASAAKYLPGWEKPKEPDTPLTYFSPPKPFPRTFTTPQDRLRLAREEAERNGVPFIEPDRCAMELQAINLLMRRPSANISSTPFSNRSTPVSDGSLSSNWLNGVEPSYSPFPALRSTHVDASQHSTPIMTPGPSNDSSFLLRMSGVKCLGTPTASIASPSDQILTKSTKVNEDQSLIFLGLTIYAEIKYLNRDKSKWIRDLVEKLGAKTMKTFAKSVNLVVFKEGRMATYLKAKQENIPIVSVLWVDACRQLGSLVDPEKFPPSTDDEYQKELFNAEQKRRDRFLRRGRLFLDRMKGLAPPSKSQKKRAATVDKIKVKEPKRSSGDKKVQKKLDFQPADQNRNLLDTNSDSADDGEPTRRNSAPADLAVNVSPIHSKLTIPNTSDILQTPAKCNENGKTASSLAKNRRKLFNPNESLTFSPAAMAASPVDTSPYWRDSPINGLRSRTTSSKRPKACRSTDCVDKKTPKAARRSLMTLIEKDEEDTANHSKNSLSCFDLEKKGGHLTRRQPRICFTSVRSQDLARYHEIILDLGAFEIDKSVTKRTTHLLSSIPPRRTVNLLRAIARGCWILDIDWLIFCKENDKWMSEEPFELKYFSEAVAKNRLQRQAFGKNYTADIFTHCGRIFVDSNVQPPQSDIIDLLKICKANVVSSSSAEIVVSDRPCSGMKGKSNAIVVSPLWVLDSITHNKLCDLDKYRLVKNQ